MIMIRLKRKYITGQKHLTLKKQKSIAENAGSTFESEKSDILSILSGETSESPDPFLKRIKDDIEKLSILKQNTIISELNRIGEVFTRDMVAMGQGLKIPPHVSVIAKVISLRHPIESCEELGKLARKAGSHIMRKQRKKKRYDVTVGKMSLSAMVDHLLGKN